MNFQSYITTLNRKGHQADGSFANGQEHSMPTDPAATPPPIPAHQPPPVPPRTGVTAKPSPTDAQVKSSTPFLEEAGRTDAKPKKPFVPPPGAVKVM